MASTDVIGTDVRRAAERSGATDALIAVLSYNHEDSIEPVLRAAKQELGQLPGRALIVQADGGSTDATLERARNAADGIDFLQLSYPVHPVHLLAIEAQAIPGRDSAYRTVFSLAEELGAKACCVIDADVGTLPPGWIRSLMEPILASGFDLVAPHYQRHKYDGLVTVGVLYPTARAVFGKRIRQPTGRDFGYSAALVRQCLVGDGWEGEGARHRVDLWVTLQALEHGLRLCQASLGPRTNPKKAIAPELSDVLSGAVGTLFGEMSGTAELWQRVRGSEPIPTFGLRFDVDTAPTEVNVAPLVAGFRLGCDNLQEIWSRVLPPTVGVELRRCARQAERDFRLPDDLWARVLYDFAVGFKSQAIGRDHLLRALTPLYLGWAASFISGLATAGAREVEERVEQLCLAFEGQKPYLISRWRWPDHFAP